jgi:uncharacterized membrane protein
MGLLILALFYLLAPVLIIFLTQKYAWINKIGAVAIAYGLGMIMGSFGIFPETSDVYNDLVLQNKDPYLEADLVNEIYQNGDITFDDLLRNKISILQSNLQNLCVVIAIPMLLFSLNLRKWIRIAGKTLFSVILALLSVILVVYSGFFIFKDSIVDPSDVSGMLIGIYAGGTPNVAAIGNALAVDPNVFIQTNAYDIIISALCLLFLITIAQRVFLIFLPAYKKINAQVNVREAAMMQESLDLDNYDGMLNRSILIQILIAVLISALVLGISYIISKLMPDEYEDAALILLITAFGLGLSLIVKINRLEKSFQAGMYLIIVFCLVLASTVDLTSILQIESLNLFLYVAFAVFGSLFVHVVLSALFRIDADTVIITSTALVYSPPFVPVIASAINNKEVIISGVTAGMLGYVIGNLLGIFTGNFLGIFL